MAEYYAVLKKAVGSFDSGSAEARRAVYDKARNALIGQLKAIDPPLPASEISRQRLELEEAIRRVERETAAAAAQAPRPQRPPEQAMPPAPSTAPEMPPSPPPVAPAAAPSPQDVFRRAIQEAESRGAARATRPSPTPQPFPPAPTPAPAAAARPAADFNPPPRPAAPPPPTETQPIEPEPEIPPAYDVSRYEPPRAQRAEPAPLAAGDPYVDQRDRPARASSKRKGFLEEDEQTTLADEPAGRSRLPTLLLFLLILGMFGGLGALGWSQRAMLGDIIAGFDAGSGGEQAASGAENAPATVDDSSKTDARLPGEESAEPVRSAGEAVPPASPAPGPDPIAEAISSSPEAPPPPAAGQQALVAQRAILYEEPLDTATAVAGVVAIDGVVTWSFDQGSNGPEIVANLGIPQRGLKIRLSIRRNTDSSLPASHLVVAEVQTPPDFPGKSVRGIPRLVMKSADSERGQPLVGAAAKVADGLFWIALSATGTDIARNLQMLRERAWFDLPIVYESGQRAVLTFEKGTPGERAFEQAFAAWNTG